jgi:PAS domain S-box-containing protein
MAAEAPGRNLISAFFRHRGLRGRIAIIILTLVSWMALLVMGILYLAARHFQIEHGHEIHFLGFLLPVILVLALASLGSALLLARISSRFITAPLLEVARIAERIAASGNPAGRLDMPAEEDLGGLAVAFNTMVERLAAAQNDLERRVAEAVKQHESSSSAAEKATSLLREAVEHIEVGFTIFDEGDRLVICNEAYRRIYEMSRDLLTPGRPFSEIVRIGAERGQYIDAHGQIDAWVAQHLEQHLNCNGEVLQQQLGDGRWIMIIEHRTPSGYIVGNRIDITDLRKTTDTLRQREFYLRATLDNMPFLFWLKDTEGRFLAVNKVFAEACGKDAPNGVVGLTDLDVWPRELAQAYRADDFEVMARRREKSVEEPVSGAVGSGWLETYKKPLVAEDGALLGTVGFARDISDRKQVEQALAESEARWQLAIAGANDGIWDWNPQTGKVFFSERWKTMLGYAPSEIGDSLDEWLTRIHPDDQEGNLALMSDHLGGKTHHYESEHRLRCKDGRYIWILARGQAMFGPDGRYERMAGSSTDVTERRAAEERIRDRNEQLNAIFELSPDGFVSFDARHRVKYANPAFFTLIGIDEQDIRGIDEDAFSARLASICLPTALFPSWSDLRACNQADDALPGKRHVIELANPGKRVIEIGLRLAEADSVSQILYFRDITHESEVDRMKSEFLSHAAHELRTPMASIYGYAELMLTESFPAEEEKSFLGVIHRQSALMVAIINELLDLARIEGRRGKDFIFERIDAGALAAEVIGGFKPPDKRPAPSLGGAVDGCWVRADRKKITQAIANVLSNAYKYSPAGGPVAVDILPARSDMAVKLVGIRVQDHGIGMTAEQIGRVSERFYRADNSGKIPSTGLGMSIVKEIVQLHSGELSIESSWARAPQ